MCASETTKPFLRRLLLVGLLCSSLAATASAQMIVSGLTDRVTDQADLLPAQTEQTLVSLLVAHEEATTNQVAVLTIASLQGVPIEEFALEVAEATGLGTAEQDNGVLLVVAVEDRKVRIEVGYGLEGALPDVVASRIIREQIVPHFRDDAYERGVERGVLAILERLESQAEPADIPEVAVEDPTPVTETSPSVGIDWWEWLPFLYFLTVLLLAGGAAALVVMEKMPERALYFLVLLPCFYFAGRSLGFFVLWYWVSPWHVPFGVVALYVMLFWTFVHRYDSDAAFKAAWRRHLLVHDSVEASSAKKDAAAPEEVVVSPYPRRLQTLIVMAAATLLALFLYTRWLSVIWLVIGAVLAWFSLRRIGEDPEQRKRRRERRWVSSVGSSSPSSSSYRSSSSSRSSYSSRSSSRYSSRSSSRYSSRSSSSSFSGGGGSFGGGGASGSW